MNWGEITNIIDGLALAVMPGALVVSIFIISVMGAQNVLYVIQLFLAYSVLRQRRLHVTPNEAWQQLNVTTMPISLLVPGYNEEATIVENVRSMLSLHYPNFEVIVINDGSTDDTLKAVIDAYDLKPIIRPFEQAVTHNPIRGLYGSKNYPNLIVVDKVNGGKSDALNAGINLARFPLFCAVDADSLLESDALLRAVQPFTE
ncbi:MAG: glycosyltransferase family 2 protein, partial [Rhodospirillaceae bacterium]|nr:glycosyltransferase family 2 protein [Rhodospirillaceae bacterium]